MQAPSIHIKVILRDSQCPKEKGDCSWIYPEKFVIKGKVGTFDSGIIKNRSFFLNSYW